MNVFQRILSNVGQKGDNVSVILGREVITRINKMFVPNSIKNETESSILV